jgi:cytosine/adenosine deaminase-related metal-dependent hydrolase
MILYDVSLYDRPGRWKIVLHKDRINKILQLDAPSETAKIVNLNGSLVLPGLINSHDHLDFNLFPKLGNRNYKNYREWGPEIQENNKSLIDEINRVPLELKIKWGEYKNLLNGFTTVLNHGRKLPVENSLITVVQNFQSLHSPGFEKNWKWKLNNPFLKNKLLTIHGGEGIDENAKLEIQELIKANYLKRKIVIIHGLSLKEEQARYFAGLVWCPASNLFMFNKTADIENLANKISICFGTDSTLTAGWNAWEQMRQAVARVGVKELALLNMLTFNPSKLFNLKDRGFIKENYKADLLVLKPGSIFRNNPEDILMVIKNGNISMADNSLKNQIEQDDLYQIKINSGIKWIKGDLMNLVETIKKYSRNTCLEEIAVSG